MTESSILSVVFIWKNMSMVWISVNTASTHRFPFSTPRTVSFRVPREILGAVARERFHRQRFLPSSYAGASKDKLVETTEGNQEHMDLSILPSLQKNREIVKLWPLLHAEPTFIFCNHCSFFEGEHPWLKHVLDISWFPQKMLAMI